MSESEQRITFAQGLLITLYQELAQSVRCMLTESLIQSEGHSFDLESLFVGEALLLTSYFGLAAAAEIAIISKVYLSFATVNLSD